MESLVQKLQIKEDLRSLRLWWLLDFQQLYRLESWKLQTN